MLDIRSKEEEKEEEGKKIQKRFRSIYDDGQRVFVSTRLSIENQSNLIINYIHFRIEQANPTHIPHRVKADQTMIVWWRMAIQRMDELEWCHVSIINRIRFHRMEINEICRHQFHGCIDQPIMMTIMVHGMIENIFANIIPTCYRRCKERFFFGNILIF